MPLELIGYFGGDMEAASFLSLITLPAHHYDQVLKRISFPWKNQGQPLSQSPFSFGSRAELQSLE
jgi:hypothetical protein